MEEEKEYIEQGFKMLDMFIYGDSQEPLTEVPRDAFGNLQHTFYESPAAFNRHIVALERSDPHPDLVPTLLSGKKPSSRNFQMFHGPPGTGKTYRLIMELRAMLQSASKDGERFLCCAYSNVGAANMFSRARSLGIRGSLIMAKSKVPSEVCVDEGC